jgi:methyl-accepting chemotaxis protein
MESTDKLLRGIYAKADRLMLVIVWCLVGISVVLATYSLTWSAVLWVALPTALIGSAMVFWCAGALVTRLVLAASLMNLAALQIHQAHGLGELQPRCRPV